MGLKVQPSEVNITLDYYEKIERLSNELHQMFVQGGVDIGTVEEKEAELHKEIQLLQKVTIHLSLPQCESQPNDSLSEIDGKQVVKAICQPIHGKPSKVQENN